jgi:acyl dehydratase
MDLGSEFVGTRLKTYKTNVDWRATTNYAAAISDHNPAYFDDTAEGGIIAHPMFAVALTWPIMERIWEFIDAPDFPMQVIATQVHYTEQLILHRPVRPGDSLVIDGEIAAILPHRAGTRAVLKLKAVDSKGEPVFTEYNSALFRGVNCPDDGRGEESLPEFPTIEKDNPSPIWSKDIFIEPERPYLYDGCTNIVFPIHTSPQFAKQVGLPCIILQGTATLALAVRELISTEADNNPQRVKSINCRFSDMVLPGNNISVNLLERQTRAEDTALFFEVINDGGRKAIKNGVITIE